MTIDSGIKINTYEGISRKWFYISLIVILLLIFVDLPVLIKIIGIVVFGLVTLTIGLQLFARNRNLAKGRWARLHYPLMILYSRALGTSQGREKTTKSDLFSDILGVSKLNDEILTDYIFDSKTEDYVYKLYEAIEKWSDTDLEEIIHNFIKKHDPKITNNEAEKLVEKAYDVLADGPQLVIAELISNEYGQKERDKYIIAVLTGKAD